LKNGLNIAFTIDNGFIRHFTIALTSLLENNSNIIQKVFLVHSIKENKLLQKSFEFFKEKYSQNVEPIYIDDKQLKSLPVKSFISTASYYRLMLSELLPSNIDKVLYLDCDIIVNGDLSKLLDLHFSQQIETSDEYISNNNLSDSLSDNDYYLYAVDQEYNKERFSRLHKAKFTGEKYFNSGVLYINLKKWRDNNITEKLLENATKYIRILEFQDQDVLNITFEKFWGELSYEYNAWKQKNKSIAKTGLSFDEIKIIHFIGPIKPWNIQCKHPYKKVYRKYFKRTPYKFQYVDLSILNILKRIIPNKLKTVIKININ
jgi:lipopolysaccharide biosynthesis glycosyltransferase